MDRVPESMERACAVAADLNTTCAAAGRSPTFTRAALLTLICLQVAVACDSQNGSAPPTPEKQSYTFPTAVIGAPIESPEQAAGVRTGIKRVADEYGLQFRSNWNDPYSQPKCQRDPQICPDYYEPPNPRMLDSFLITHHAYSDRCSIISLSDYSGSWTARSLKAFEALYANLNRATDGHAQILVRPKKEQNWPQSNSVPDPERPMFLQELCVRMGLPDPRAPGDPTLPPASAPSAPPAKADSPH